jgi:hypothetical protein
LHNKIKHAKKKTIILLILIISTFFTNTATAETNNIKLKFFYTSDCEICHNKETVIDQIETNYPNISITRYLVLVDKNLDNYTLFKNFYAFEHVPAAVITNNTYNFQGFKSYNVTYSNLEKTIKQYINDDQIIEQKVNNTGIYIDYYYSENNENSIKIKKEILEKIETNNQNTKSIFFRYKNIEEYNWDYQKYVSKYSTSYPFIIIKDFINETILTENNITEDKIISTLNNSFDITLNYQNQTINETKNDNRFFLPGFEIIQLFIVLTTLILLINKKKKTF